MNRRWRWLLLVVPVVLIGTYATAIFRAYRTPPLMVRAEAASAPKDVYAVGVDLENGARYPVRLSDASVPGVPGAKVTAVVSIVEPDSTAACTGGTAALDLEACNPHQTGNVAGWRVNPWRPRENMHGLRVELPLDTAPAERTLVVSYRYLGWPFTTQAKLEWY